MKSSFSELKSNYTHIYTYGSKDDMRVGCVVVSSYYSKNMRIPYVSSIFITEATAIELALDFYADCEISNKFYNIFQIPFWF